MELFDWIDVDADYRAISGRRSVRKASGGNPVRDGPAGTMTPHLRTPNGSQITRGVCRIQGWTANSLVNGMPPSQTIPEHTLRTADVTSYPMQWCLRR